MIKKYNQFNEGVLDKLQGPNKDEVTSYFRQMFVDGKIDIEEYHKKAKALNIQGPTEEDIRKSREVIRNNKNLEIAVDKGNIKGVKRLLDKGANIHIIKDYPLRHFSYKGNLEMVKYLIERGADINAFNGESIIIASSNGYLDIVKYLVENGADIHEQSDQALTYAIQKNHLDIVKYLIGVGCGDKSYLYRNFINAARKTEDTELIDYIEKHLNRQIKEGLLNKLEGPNEKEVRNALSKMNYETALEKSIEHGYVDFVKKYLKLIDIKVKDKDRLLFIAIDSNNIEIVKILIDNGADINCEDSIPLFFAAENGDKKMVEFILNYYLKNDYSLDSININDAIEVAGNTNNNDIVDLLNKYKKLLKEND